MKDRRFWHFLFSWILGNLFGSFCRFMDVKMFLDRSIKNIQYQ